MIPSLLALHLRTATGRRIRLWIPLFLVWLVLLPVAPLLLMLLLVGALIGRINPWRAVAVLWGILTSLSGVNVDVSSPQAEVAVRMI